MLSFFIYEAIQMMYHITTFSYQSTCSLYDWYFEKTPPISEKDILLSLQKKIQTLEDKIDKLNHV